jgi:hypothetical protein
LAAPIMSILKSYFSGKIKFARHAINAKHMLLLIYPLTGEVESNKQQESAQNHVTAAFTALLPAAWLSARSATDPFSCHPLEHPNRDFYQAPWMRTSRLLFASALVCQAHRS